MIENKDGLLINNAIQTIKHTAIQKSIIEILIENGLTTKEHFDKKANDIFIQIKDEEMQKLLEASPDELEVLKKRQQTK